MSRLRNSFSHGGFKLKRFRTASGRIFVPVVLVDSGNACTAPGDPGLGLAAGVPARWAWITPADRLPPITYSPLLPKEGPKVDAPSEAAPMDGSGCFSLMGLAEMPLGIVVLRTIELYVIIRVGAPLKPPPEPVLRAQEVGEVGIFSGIKMISTYNV